MYVYSDDYGIIFIWNFSICFAIADLAINVFYTDVLSAIPDHHIHPSLPPDH